MTYRSKITKENIKGGQFKKIFDFLSFANVMGEKKPLNPCSLIPHFDEKMYKIAKIERFNLKCFW